MATVTLSQSRAVPVPVDEAFDRALAHPLTEIFRRRRLAISPINGVRDQQGEWGTVGQTRTIVLADGGTMLETLTSNDRPHSFGYTISEIRGPMKPLVAHPHAPRPGGDAGLRDDVARLRPTGARGDRSHPAQVSGHDWEALNPGCYLSNRLGVWRSW